MDPSPIDAVPVPANAGPTGILLSRDLIFTSKVTGTAAALGIGCWWQALRLWPWR